MRRTVLSTVCARAAGLGSLLLAASPLPVAANGFQIEEQSTYFQGMAHAGAAAGGSLSSMFWNPAAAGTVGKGLTTEDSYTYLRPTAELTVTSISGTIAPLLDGKDETVDIGRDAFISSGYAAWRGDVDPRLVFALSINGTYGLGSKADNIEWAGEMHYRSADMVTMNVAPTVAYEIMPGVTIGAGVQFQHMDLKSIKTAAAPGGENAVLEGSDLGLGFTAGILLKPAPGTSIGLGFRSSVTHELSGSLSASGLDIPAFATVKTPERVTLSFEQALSSNFRATGTIGWTNWSRLGTIPVVLATGDVAANMDFEWEDSWMFSLGGEYDVSPALTVRAGVAYTLTPIPDPARRPVDIVDSNTLYLAAGGSYRWSDSITIHSSYYYMDLEESSFSRLPSSTDPALSDLRLEGTADVDIHVLSVGMTTRW